MINKQFSLDKIGNDNAIKGVFRSLAEIDQYVMIPFKSGNETFNHCYSIVVGYDDKIILSLVSGGVTQEKNKILATDDDEKVRIFASLNERVYVSDVHKSTLQFITDKTKLERSLKEANAVSNSENAFAKNGLSNIKISTPEEQSPEIILMDVPKALFKKKQRGTQRYIIPKKDRISVEICDIGDERMKQIPKDVHKELAVQLRSYLRKSNTEDNSIYTKFEQLFNSLTYAQTFAAREKRRIAIFFSPFFNMDDMMPKNQSKKIFDANFCGSSKDFFERKKKAMIASKKVASRANQSDIPFNIYKRLEGEFNVVGDCSDNELNYINHVKNIFSNALEKTSYFSINASKGVELVDIGKNGVRLSSTVPAHRRLKEGAKFNITFKLNHSKISLDVQTVNYADVKTETGYKYDLRCSFQDDISGHILRKIGIFINEHYTPFSKKAYQ